MLHLICTRLRPGHFSVRVGDGSRGSEEIVKKSRIAPVNAIIIIVIINVCREGVKWGKKVGGGGGG